MNFLNELILILLAEPAKVRILFSSLRNGHQGKSELNTPSVVCAPHFTVMLMPVYTHTHACTGMGRDTLPGERVGNQASLQGWCTVLEGDG